RVRPEWERRAAGDGATDSGPGPGPRAGAGGAPRPRGVAPGDRGRAHGRHRARRAPGAGAADRAAGGRGRGSLCPAGGRVHRAGLRPGKVAGGYRFQTHPDCAPYVERYLLEGRHARLSGAALETLAVIAYKQPVTRSQLSAVRGVDVDGVVRSLLDRGYIEEVGRTDGVGHPVQYGTTRLFL